MKRKILYYTDCYLFGGSEVLLANLMNSKIIEKDFDRHFAYTYNKNYNKEVDRLIDNSIIKHSVRLLSNASLFYRLNSSTLHPVITKFIKAPFVVLETTGFYMMYNYTRLYFLFKKIQPDLLHINNGGYPAARSCIAAVFSAKTAGINNIIMRVNNIAQKQKSRVEKYIDKYVSVHVDYFITASSIAKATLSFRRGFPANKIIQIFNSVIEEQPKNSRETVLNRHNIAPEQFVIVNVGLLTEQKGHKYLIYALSEIRNQDTTLFDKIALLIVGDGEQRNKLEELIIQYELSEKVILVGRRNDYVDYISAADVFVFPSIGDEDMPLVILSAMKLGKPVIATKVAGIVEQIEDDLNGILINPNEIAGLTNAISILYHHPSLRIKHGDASKKRFSELFSNETMASNYRNVYQKLNNNIHK